MLAPLARRRPRPLWIALAILAVAAPLLGGQPPEGGASTVYRVVQSYPHDPAAYTQGLVYHQGFFYESTGLHGKSSLRKVVPETGEVIRAHLLPAEHFGEGLARWGDRLIQLTWRSRIGLVYELSTFRQVGTFPYASEGWGLTGDGTSLIMSDGTSTLRFLHPETYRETGRMEVRRRGAPVDRLNELEYVRGEILANVWEKDEVLRISPSNGEVLETVDLSGLRAHLGPSRGPEVLNGIAYDPEGNRLFVTGKLWPRVFQIEIRGLNGSGL